MSVHVNGQGQRGMDGMLSQHEHLKQLAHAAVRDYEELQRLYDDNLQQYEDVKSRLLESETKLRNLETVLSPACDEYNRINQRLQVEEVCREEAVSFATKVNFENNKLKRQSQMLLDKVSKTDPSVLAAILDETESDSSDVMVDQSAVTAFNEKITVLENEIKSLEARLLKSETERVAAITREEDLLKKYKRLQAELLAECKRNTAHQQVEENFKRTSVLAWSEFNELKEKLDLESKLKQQAEMYAIKMLAERDASFRQSSILLTSVASDAKLMEAMLQIEEVTKQRETEKKEAEEKVKALEDQLAESRDNERLQRQQTELEIATSEVERLQTAVNELEEWKKKMMEENDEIRSKLNEAEEKLRPPPPPPPPPCPPVFIRPAAIIIKPVGAGVGVTPTDGPAPVTPLSVQDAAIKELKAQMERIKNGGTLRIAQRKFSTPGGPTNSTETPKMPSAMDNLQQILKGLKEKRAFNESLDPPTTPRSPLSPSNANSTFSPGGPRSPFGSDLSARQPKKPAPGPPPKSGVRKQASVDPQVFNAPPALPGKLPDPRLSKVAQNSSDTKNTAMASQAPEDDLSKSQPPPVSQRLSQAGKPALQRQPSAASTNL